jgi:hypothetical protein
VIANQETGTCVDEVAAGIYRICTPLEIIPGGFTVNSYLIDDAEPMLFHAGYRKLFPTTLEAVSNDCDGLAVRTLKATNTAPSTNSWPLLRTPLLLVPRWAY